MKLYPKNYQDLFLPDSKLVKLEYFETVSGEQPRELAHKFRAIFRENFKHEWDFMIKFIWLEHQIVFKKKRRFRWKKYGHATEMSYNRFMTEMVGIDHRSVTRGSPFIRRSVYLKEIFPDFLRHDPFVDFEYYQFPFDHVTLDFMDYVHQVEYRMDLLTYAEEQKMTYFAFTNWVNNYVLSYNDDKGSDIYAISEYFGAPCVVHNNWEKMRDKFIFSDEDHGKIETNSNDN